MTNVATLQTAADLSASITAQGISSLVPSGVVMAYAGASAPTGWLLCNGAAVSQTTYADLFAALSYAHGNPGGGSFNLPNYAGRFIRGRANGSANDPDRAARTAANTGGATGDAVGSVQVNATAKNGLTASAASSSVTGTVGGSDGLHSHNATANSPATVGTSFFDRSSGNFPTGSQPVVPSSGSGHGHSHTLTAAAQTITVGAGDNETRPLNAYVNYIIKV